MTDRQAMMSLQWKKMVAEKKHTVILANICQNCFVSVSFHCADSLTLSKGALTSS